MTLGAREITYIVILLFLVVASGFFSGSETALMRSRRFRIRHLVDEGNADAARVEGILSEPDRLISTILLGNNFVNVLGSAIATALFISLFGDEGIVYATIAMTVILLIFAEITPKTVAAYRPEEFSMTVSRPMRWIIRVLHPMARVLTWISGGLVRLLGVDTQKQPAMTEEDVGSVISIGHQEGFIQESKARMLTAILDLDAVPVRKVMIPLGDIRCIAVECAFDDILNTIITRDFSRYPVYEDSRDNILGYLHIRDLWRHIDQRETFSVRDCLREAHFVPETKSTLKQLVDFQQMHIHMAFVVDEYGTVKGAITLEDIIEEITGEIMDEHDSLLEPVVPVGKGRFLVRGNIALRDLGRAVGRDFPEEVDTLSGLIYSLLDRVPEEGEKVVWEDFLFKVERMRGNRISLVRMVKQNIPHPPAEDEEG